MHSVISPTNHLPHDTLSFTCFTRISRRSVAGHLTSLHMFHATSGLAWRIEDPQSQKSSFPIFFFLRLFFSGRKKCIGGVMSCYTLDEAIVSAAFLGVFTMAAVCSSLTFVDFWASRGELELRGCLRKGKEEDMIDTALCQWIDGWRDTHID